MLWGYYSSLEIACDSLAGMSTPCSSIGKVNGGQVQGILQRIRAYERIFYLTQTTSSHLDDSIIQHLVHTR